MDDVRKHLVTTTNEILKDIRATIRRIRKELEKPDIVPEQSDELHYALCICLQHEREAHRLLAPEKRDGISCCTQLTYDEIPLERVYEVLTEEYCESLIKLEQGRSNENNSR